MLVSHAITKDGIKSQCSHINSRIEELRNKYNIADDLSIANHEIGELLTRYRTHFPSTKMGTHLSSDVLEILEANIIDPDTENSTSKIFKNEDEPENTENNDKNTLNSRACGKNSSSEILECADMMKQEEIAVAFVNVIAMYYANCRVDLPYFHKKVRCVNFNPTWFNSAVVTLPASSCRVAVFENGKLMITGVNSIKTALIATRHVLELLKMCKFQPEVKKSNFEVKNLIATVDLQRQVDIVGFAERYPEKTYMDNDIFGAVSYMPEKSTEKIHHGDIGLCFLVFSTGKINMVGGKTEMHLLDAFRDQMLRDLMPFVRNVPNTV